MWRTTPMQMFEIGKEVSQAGASPFFDAFKQVMADYNYTQAQRSKTKSEIAKEKRKFKTDVALESYKGYQSRKTKAYDSKLKRKAEHPDLAAIMQLAQQYGLDVNANLGTGGGWEADFSTPSSNDVASLKEDLKRIAAEAGIKVPTLGTGGTPEDTFTDSEPSFPPSTKNKKLVKHRRM